MNELWSLTWSRVAKSFGRSTLLLTLGLAASLWLFLFMAGQMVEGHTQTLDEAMLLGLREAGDLNDPIGPRWLEESARDVTALGGFTLLSFLTIVGVIGLLRSRRRREALILATVMVSGQVASELLKLAYSRPRPALVPHGSIVYSNSFPSGHSALSAAGYLMLAVILAGMLRRRASVAMTYVTAVLIVAAVGVSRVYLGVHWPSDVAAGWALGATFALVGWALLRHGGSPRDPLASSHSPARPGLAEDFS